MATGTYPIYRVICFDCRGEHYATNDAERAYDEANAHERALGHETRIVHMSKSEIRRRGGVVDPDDLYERALRDAAGTGP